MSRASGNGAAKLRVAGLAVLGWVLMLALTVPSVAQVAAPVAPAKPRTPRTVLVSIPDRKLAVLEDGNVIAQFRIAVGAAASPSPTGEFEIVTRVVNPTYYHEGVVIPTGKDNPVGTRWIGLNAKGYGIHGTNAPRSIGHATSHGCIRLRNRDVERLFTMVRAGDAVEIRGERDEQTAQIFGGVAEGTVVAAAESGSLEEGSGQ